jgi:Cobalamin synthesis protein cobW C-terminal domain
LYLPESPRAGVSLFKLFRISYLHHASMSPRLRVHDHFPAPFHRLQTEADDLGIRPAHAEKTTTRWSPIWGDRKNELVFIGQDFERERITIDLNRCLLRDWEVEVWREGEAFNDPFPN